MEASALPAQVGLARTRIAIGAPLLRLRSDEQLVSLFRDGHDDAFRVIHDRYRTRLVAYTRQMLAGSPADAEDAVQEIFVRAYAGLRVDARELALRPWLYRVAHNRCIDELRRPATLTSDRLPDTIATSLGDPVAHVEQRDALRRLIIDVSRLPEQQRSALLMRELGGMTYVDLAAALGLTVPAVKSLLVRARVSLAAASQARDATCAEIQADLVLAHDRGVRCSGLARRHLRDCAGCRTFRADLRTTSHQLAALLPLGPLGAIASLLGLGGSGAAAGGGAVATGSGAAASGGLGGLSSGVGASLGLGGLGAAGAAGHVATLLAAAVVTAGGAIEIQQHIAGHPPAAAHHRMGERSAAVTASHLAGGPAAASFAGLVGSAGDSAGATPGAPGLAGAAGTASPSLPLIAPAVTVVGAGSARRVAVSVPLSLTEQLDPDHLLYSLVGPGPGLGPGLSGPPAVGTGTTAGSGGTAGTVSSGGTAGSVGAASTTGSVGSGGPASSGAAGGSAGGGASGSAGAMGSGSGGGAASGSAGGGASGSAGGGASGSAGTAAGSSATAGPSGPAATSSPSTAPSTAPSTSTSTGTAAPAGATSAPASTTPPASAGTSGSSAAGSPAGPAPGTTSTAASAAPSGAIVGSRPSGPVRATLHRAQPRLARPSARRSSVAAGATRRAPAAVFVVTGRS